MGLVNEADRIVLKAETLFYAHRSSLSYDDCILVESRIQW